MELEEPAETALLQPLDPPGLQVLLVIRQLATEWVVAEVEPGAVVAAADLSPLVTELRAALEVLAEQVAQVVLVFA